MTNAGLTNSMICPPRITSSWSMYRTVFSTTNSVSP